MPKHKAYFDGSCLPTNPGGTARYGIVIYKDNAVIYKDCQFVGAGPRMTSNVAEYCGLIGVLNYIKEHNIQDITIYGDSTLVVNQMNLKWAIKKGFYKDYAHKAFRLFYSFPSTVKIEWLPREDNELADALSKQMDYST